MSLKNIIGVTEYLGKQIIANGGDRAREAMETGERVPLRRADRDQTYYVGRFAKER